MDQPTGLRMSNVAPGSTQPVSLDYHDQADLSEVRRFVRRAALAHGLDDARVERLILAVSELATNTLQHTSNGGQVRVWADGDSVLCEVIDAGPPRSFGNMPAADAVRGRGLAIVRLAVDEVSSTAGPDGTVV